LEGYEEWCGSGFKFTKWGEGDSCDLYHPLKIHVLKVPNQTFTNPEVKGEKLANGGLGVESPVILALVVMLDVY